MKSHLLTMDGNLSPIGVGHLNSILRKRKIAREQNPGGIVGAFLAVISIFKNADHSFFY